MLNVPIALTCPAFGFPTIMPYCCCTAGSEAVGSMRPNSSGGARFLLGSGEDGQGAAGFLREKKGAAAPPPPASPGPPGFIKGGPPPLGGRVGPPLLKPAPA